MIPKETEMAYWRRQYEENYEAAACAHLSAFAITAPHQFITTRMEHMAHALKEMVRLDGAEAVKTYLRQEGTTHEGMDAGNPMAKEVHRDAGHAASTSNPACTLEADAAGTPATLPDEP
jgi:hypothetical protein